MCDPNGQNDENGRVFSLPKKLMVALAIIVICIVAGYLYLDSLLFFNQWVKPGLERAFDVSVSVESYEVSGLSRISIGGIHVETLDREPNVSLSVGELDIDIALAPLLRRKLRIESMRVSNVAVECSGDDGGKLVAQGDLSTKLPFLSVSEIPASEKKSSGSDRLPVSLELDELEGENMSLSYEFGEGRIARIELHDVRMDWSRLHISREKNILNADPLKVSGRGVASMRLMEDSDVQLSGAPAGDFSVRCSPLQRNNEVTGAHVEITVSVTDGRIGDRELGGHTLHCEPDIYWLEGSRVVSLESGDFVVKNDEMNLLEGEVSGEYRLNDEGGRIDLAMNIPAGSLPEISYILGLGNDLDVDAEKFLQNMDLRFVVKVEAANELRRWKIYDGALSANTGTGELGKISFDFPRADVDEDWESFDVREGVVEVTAGGSQVGSVSVNGDVERNNKLETRFYLASEALNMRPVLLLWGIEPSQDAEPLVLQDVSMSVISSGHLVKARDGSCRVVGGKVEFAEVQVVAGGETPECLWKGVSIEGVDLGMIFENLLPEKYGYLTGTVYGSSEGKLHGTSPEALSEFFRSKLEVRVEDGEIRSAGVLEGLAEATGLPWLKAIVFDEICVEGVSDQEGITVVKGDVTGREQKINITGDVTYTGELDLSVRLALGGKLKERVEQRSYSALLKRGSDGYLWFPVPLVVGGTIESPMVRMDFTSGGIMEAGVRVLQRRVREEEEDDEGAERQDQAEDGEKNDEQMDSRERLLNLLGERIKKELED
jgi:hypothetical protein